MFSVVPSLLVFSHSQDGVVEAVFKLSGKRRGSLENQEHSLMVLTASCAMCLDKQDLGFLNAYGTR